MPEQASKEKINVLIIIIDTNPFVWGKRALESKKSMDVKPKLTFSQMLNHVLVFTNTYLLSKSHNRLAIIASHHKHRFDCCWVLITFLANFCFQQKRNQRKKL